ncbi:hypothetical protein K2Z83_01645 [Oscillochloris sp. ZM17-4]|uniref:hypothetical protein n=1 Tax=Oscillochloris sp. ZM17-4 TaxID=2866714 RepID=UPI001C730446|nr:hypothetical protein [Oscillochloris sp. ZM17-4]MBX0326396.1 hypothetical protein [Oscillochloris sp. ZM17-4]
MSSISTAPRLSTGLDLRGALARAWAANWPLTLVGLAMVPTLLIALIGLAIDPRLITGAPAWMKPAKFAISIAIYSFTFIWMLGFVRGPRLRRMAGVAASLTAVAFMVEMVVIVLQVVRGTTSHFNVSTPLNAALFSTMGIFIMLLWVMGLLLAVALVAQRMADRPMALALRSGIVITLVGAGLGFLMTTTTAAQQASVAAGGAMTVSGAHAVGAPDDAPGLPIVGWSTQGGDIRVSHFVGLHAMQVLPFIGWLVGRRRRLGVGRQTALVGVAGAGYLGLVLLLAWQALRAQPLLAPDALTLGVGAALVVAVAAGAAAAMAGGRRA